jgi:glycine oxidase
MSEVRHVVVIGGGAAGCAAAYALTAAGARVTLVEREGVGTQASGWSAGGINPLQGIPDSLASFALASYRLHLAWWPELARLTDRDLQARTISMAFVAPDEAAVPALLADQARFGATEGFSAEWLDREAFRGLEPRVRPDIVGALVTRGNGVVDSQAFTVSLAQAAQRQGATLTSGAVTNIRQAGGRVTGVELGDTALECDVVVVAMGPWSAAAADWLGLSLPVEPLKGEILRMAPAGPPLACDVIGPDVSLFGRADGQVWIGATQQRLGFDREPSAWAYRTLFEAGVALMPSLADATLVKQTACLRPVTPDGLPIIGAVPGCAGAFIATGGGTKGILLAPAMGQAIADLVLTGSTTQDIASSRPDRFAPVSR